MIDQQLIAFTVASAILAVTPGNDTILTMKNSLMGGRAAGFATMLGIICGCLVHAAFSALGISIILVKSAALFNTVKLIGAAYLIYLGIRTLWSLWKSRHAREANEAFDPSNNGSNKTARRAFAEGLLTNVLNPKVAIFYLSFLPQFINPNDSVMARSFLLAGIHQFVGAIWLSCIVMFVTRMRGLLTRANVRRKLESLTALVLIGFGIKLALDRK